jgi:hypothetical protein
LVAHYPFNGNASDESGNGHNGTVIGATLTTDRFGNFNSAYSFDGNDRIAVPDDPALTFGIDPFTIMAWLKFSSFSVDGGYYLMGHSAGPGNTNKWIFWLGNDGISFVQGPDVGWIPLGTAMFELGRWYNVAIRRNGSELTAFVDGRSIGTVVRSFNIPDPAATLMIGSAELDRPNRPFRGSIDDVRIYNRALSDSEITEISTELATFFPEVAIGGGYSTVFSLVNTGSSTLTGTLTLTNSQNGNPLTASMSDGITSLKDSIFALSIPSGGTAIITADAVNTNDPTKVGWACVTSTGGTLGGVATFKLTGATGTLQTIAGVLSSTPVSAATIPVDDNVSALRYTGYAIANTGTSAIIVDVQEVNADGSLAASLKPLEIPAGQQTASFLFEDAKALQTFQGSAVFIGQSGATFSIVALVFNQGLMTAIPVIPGAAPGR